MRCFTRCIVDRRGCKLFFKRTTKALIRLRFRIFTGRILDSHGYKVSSCGQENSDQTAIQTSRIHRLIGIFAGCTCQKIPLLPSRLICLVQKLLSSDYLSRRIVQHPTGRNNQISCKCGINLVHESK